MKEMEPGEVHLPPSVKHGGPNAYGHYRCRCRKCQQWRRDYDNDRTARDAWLRETQRDASRKYIKSKGLHLYGPGPFRRNPQTIATMIASVLGEDLHAYVEAYRKEHPRVRRT